MELADFRNFERGEARFAPGVNVVVGRNGQGKTNLLEAVHVLCALGSHRTSGTEVLVRRGAGRAVLRGWGSSRGRPVRVDVEVRREGGIRLMVNRVPLERSHGAAVGFAAVLFSPDDLSIVKGGPEERRRFVDHAAARVRLLAAAERQEFDRVLRQRNGLLKAAASSRRALSTLEVWDEQLARAGAAVVHNRLVVLGRMLPRVADRYGEVAGGGVGVELAYRASWAGDREVIPERVEDELRAAVARSRGRDLERGMSLVGPHRDDVAMAVAGLDARSFASQGEQRSLVLALRLAERDLVAEVREEDPILLLDDVFSELDEERGRRLAALVLGGGQAVATVTSLPGGLPAGPEGAAYLLRVEGGRIVAA